MSNTSSNPPTYLLPSFESNSCAQSIRIPQYGMVESRSSALRGKLAGAITSCTLSIHTTSDPRALRMSYRSQDPQDMATEGQRESKDG